jgi:hypothetical protein
MGEAKTFTSSTFTTSLADVIAIQPDGVASVACEAAATKMRRPFPAPRRVPSTRPDFRFETKKLCRLHVDIMAPAGVQANDVEISITPALLENIPAPVEAFFLRREERMVDSAYFETCTDAPSIDVAVQRGTYRIYASRIDYRRHMSTVPLPPNLKAETVTVMVDHDQSVRMQLAVLPDEALLP